MRRRGGEKRSLSARDDPFEIIHQLLKKTTISFQGKEVPTGDHLKMKG